MKIVEIRENKKEYLELLLLADEQESMIDRYLDRGSMYALFEDGVRAVCVVTDEGGGILELKNLAVWPEYQRKGYGKQLMEYWEQDMKRQGYGMLLTSTQVDETAQHFYRKLGYKDCGGFVIDIPAYAQPMELFLIKEI